MKTDEQVLLVECGAWLIALPLAAVVRLVSPDAAPVLEVTRPTSAGLHTRRIDGIPHAIWDLAHVLNQRHQTLHTLVQVRMAFPLALAVGAGRQICTPPTTTLIPAVALRSPLPLACFPVPASDHHAGFALLLDPRRLLSRAQLQASSAQLASPGIPAGVPG